MKKLRMLFRFLFPLVKQRDRQKITVEHKQAIPKMCSCPEAITQHLYHMGNGFVPFPLADYLVPIVDLDGQWKAEGLYGISNQYANCAEKVSMNKGRLRSGFGLLHHLFYTGHIFPIRSPFRPITNQNRPASNPSERGL